MSYLLTHFGTLVYLDEMTGVLRHGALVSVPRNVVAVDLGGAIGLFRKGADGGMLDPIGDMGPGGCRYVAGDRSPLRLKILPRGSDSIGMSWSGYYLTAEPDGGITLFRTHIGHWEEFLVISEQQCDGLYFVCENSWIRNDPRVVCRPTDIVPTYPFAFRFGDVALPIRGLLRLIDGPADRHPAVSLGFTMIYDGWKAIQFRLFRPLLMLTAFGRSEIFNCATLAIDSLITNGGWDGTVLLLTDRAHADFSTMLSSREGQLRVLPIPCSDTMDFALARYRIIELDDLERFQPILYIDTDVVCDGSLTSLVETLCFAKDIYTLHEGKLLDESDYFGNSLFERDLGSVGRDEPAFSTGILGFQNIAAVRQQFQLILDSAYGFALETSRRDAFRAFDQPFANYIIRKAVGKTENLDRWARLNHYVSEPDDSAAKRLGLIHFAGGVGNAGPKYERMRSYLKRIS